MNLKHALVPLGLLFLVSATASASPREIGYGIWLETYKGTYMYTVDTEAQVCLAVVAMSQGGGPAAVDCAKLKRRAEWKNIITWINDAPPPPPAPAK
jgi:hypothetical protein